MKQKNKDNITSKTTKNQKGSLTALQKKEICLALMQKPQSILAEQYGVAQNTISDVWCNKDKWLSIDHDTLSSKKKKNRPLSYPQIESALAIWLNLAVDNNITITTDILKQKAKDFAVLFDIEHFTGSAGWMSGFKRRYNVQSYLKSGEGNSAPRESLEEERAKLHDIISNYDR